MSFITVYITNPNEKAAQVLTQQLLEKKIIACANLFPIQSSYWWQGTIERESEWVALVKTIPENWPGLKESILKLHPYEVPCIMKTEVEANEAYEDWIKKSVVKLE